MRYLRNFVIALIISLTFVNCCYNGIYSENGLPRKKISDFKIKNSIITNIDTLAIYKSVISYAYNNLEKKFVFIEKEDANTYPYTSYLKFYPNDKLGLFIIAKSDTLNLNREHFNPSNAKMGYYIIDGKNIKTKTSLIFQCNQQVLRQKGIINGDTLKLEDVNNHGNIYIKKNIPIEYLKNWKPDW